MFHSSGFAIAAGVIGVGSAVAGGVMSSQAAGKAAGAQASAGKKLQRQTRRATQSYEERMGRATDQFVQQQNELQQRVADIDPNLDIPKYDLRNATLEGIETANMITSNTLKQLENIAPGSTQARQQVGSIIGSYLRGEVPQDVREQTMRNLAEMGGAGFNIATAGRGMGIQAPQANLARSLGLTSLQLQQTGMEADWRRQAQAFTMMQRPTEMMQLGLQGRAQDIQVAAIGKANQFKQAGMIGDIGSQMFGAQTGLAQALYGAQTGLAQQGYQTQQATNEAMLARDMANVQAVQGVGEATAGALGGIGSAYSQLATAQGSSTKPLSSGFYAGELGAAKAYNVSPSQLSYQRGGGFYYSPSGVYGR
jgi:hypothetical protein